MVEACLPHLGPRGRAWLEQRFARFIEGGGSLAAPRVLVHADLGCAHVLAGPDGRLAGVIDWGDALIADPAYDLAALLAECPRGFAERVIDAYEGPASRDPDMRRRAAFYVDALPIWQVFYGGDIDGGRSARWACAASPRGRLLRHGPRAPPRDRRKPAPRYTPPAHKGGSVAAFDILVLAGDGIGPR